ncbi:MAG: helix-turn-helix domain-containing protein [candidate division KSB1 bacterium]|nr:helix-turn-helix domain-containing protein [candidate division KSB1 bacterium]MDZ7366018.1 helix-turn-helix domain-containing protein [candidate division KSB1 bacterium]MDZ7404135.1 helix-turn-helix domain-containing protein [candidate division KSB1 bacterium]
MKEIGAEIQQARLAKGLTLEEISHQTHIQLAHLQKIENGQFDFLPRPYVVAFIKTFAQQAGLNGEALINRWREAEQLQQAQEAVSRQTVERKTPAPTVSLKPRPLAAAGSTAISLPIPYLKEILIGFGMIVAAVLIFLLSRWGNRETPTPLESAVKLEDAKKLQERPFEQVSQQAQQQSEIKMEPALVLSELVLQAQFESTTRLRMIRDGRDTTITTYRAGETKTWQAKEKFILRISTGGVVNLTLAGKNLGKFGQANKIEHLTITRDGVTVRFAVTPQPPKPRAAMPLDSLPIRRPQQ